jgi:hypothetical protein
MFRHGNYVVLHHITLPRPGGLDYVHIGLFAKHIKT